MLRAIQCIVIFAVGFSLPLQGVSMQMGPMRMTATKLVAIVLLALGGLQIATGATHRARDRKTPWIFAFAISYALSAFVASFDGLPLIAQLPEASSHLALILYYFLLTYVLRSRDDVFLLLFALLLGGAITSLPPVLGQERGAVVENEFETARFEGLSGQANLFGRDMAICVAIAAVLYLTNRATLRRLVVLGAGALTMAGLAFSLSRAALVSAVGMWGLWLFRFRRVGSLKYVAPALVLSFAAYFVLPLSVRLRLETVFDPEKREEEGSAESRIFLAEWGLKAFLQNPVAGVGTLNFISWAQRQPGGRGIEHVVHTGYLEVASGQGLLGLVPWMGILILTWGDYTRAWRLARAHRNKHDPLLHELGQYAVFLQIALFGSLVGALAHPMTKSKTMWTLYALSSVILGLARQRVAQLEASPTWRPEESSAFGSVGALGLPAPGDVKAR